jgi:hypothetical protein
MQLTSPELDKERLQVAAQIDVLLQKVTGHRCCFAAVWVQADVAPAVAGYSANVSATDAVDLLQGAIKSLRENGD